MTKQRIVAEIRRTAAANGGKPLGWRSFATETGIGYNDWYGKHWKSWGDAVAEAGLRPNTMVRRKDDTHLLERYAALARELGRSPVTGDLLLKRRSDPSFPAEKVFRRFGSRAKLTAVVRAYCEQNTALADLVGLFPVTQPAPEEDTGRSDADLVEGFVYLLRSGKFYKIGKTNSIGRRERELAIQLPEKSSRVHAIKTDDPTGIEAYWHNRFADKRAHGEWFALSAADVAAFKRRRFQ